MNRIFCLSWIRQHKWIKFTTLKGSFFIMATCRVQPEIWHSTSKTKSHFVHYPLHVALYLWTFASHTLLYLVPHAFLRTLVNQSHHFFQLSVCMTFLHCLQDESKISGTTPIPYHLKLLYPPRKHWPTFSVSLCSTLSEKQQWRHKFWQIKLLNHITDIKSLI